jgi:Holliday junction resolvase RusA-like endonuclease
VPNPVGTIALELPFPPSELSGNGRLHWAKRQRAVREYREDCRRLAYSERNGARGVSFPLTPPVTLHVLFVLPDHRRRDFDNLSASLKPGIDGLVAAGVIADDSVEALRPDSPRFEYGSPPGCVRLVLEAAS